MNLYLISQDVNSDYDTYDSAVVAAESEEDARQIHPGSIHSWWNPDEDPSWRYRDWAPPAKVTAKLIGTAEPNTPPGVILASFNAG